MGSTHLRRSHDSAQQTVPRVENPFRYVHSVNFPQLLETLRVTLLVTTYQAGKLGVFRSRGGRLTLLPRTFQQAMGLAVSPNRLAVGTQHQVWFLENDSDLASAIRPEERNDACFLPRRAHVTGNIHVHEMAWGASDNLWLVNTLFSCLVTLDGRYSFVPQWRPPFVSGTAAEDRCHLNGLAMQNGQPRFVTAFAETDRPDGWRPTKAKSGCVIDVTTGETVCRGLAMPHSPRLYDGRLWVLDSGRGRLVTVDREKGTIECVAELPGYTRGLAFCGGLAFVGLSRIRETATFGGVPIAERRDDLKCGVWIVDVNRGTIECYLEFEQDVTEIFDVQLLAGITNPHVVGLEKDTIQRAFVLPKGAHE